MSFDISAGSPEPGGGRVVTDRQLPPENSPLQPKAWTRQPWRVRVAGHLIRREVGRQFRRTGESAAIVISHSVSKEVPN